METTEFTVMGVKNPMPEDYVFTWDKVPYVAKAGTVTNFPKFLAEHAALKMARLIVTNQFGIVKVNDKELMDKTIASLLVENTGYAIPKPKTEAQVLQEQVHKMNEESEVGASEQAEVIEDSFQNLNDEKIVTETEEEMIAKEKKINNPKAAEADAMATMSSPKLRAIATKEGVWIKGMTQEEMVKAVMEKKYGV